MARRAIRMLTVVFLAALGLLACTAPAMARVSIVPGGVKGGGTETFAFRFANERTDSPSTKLVLTFPQDPPIAYAEVAPVRGWTVKITPRTPAQPLRIGDRDISQVVDSIIIEGGSVGPRQFDQFNITLGPLPTGGKLAFTARQSYQDGQVDDWSGATAPVIAFTGGPGAPVAPPPSGPVAYDGGPADEAQAPAAASDSGGLPPFALLWGGLGLAVLIVAAVGIRARLQARKRNSAPAGQAEPSEVVHK